MFVSSEIIKVYFLLTCAAVVTSSSGRSSEQMLPESTSFQSAVGKETTALTQAYFLLTIPALNTLNTSILSFWPLITCQKKGWKNSCFHKDTEK